MRRACRHLLTSSRRRRQRTVADLLRHARIVTDPETLSYLNGEVKKRIAASKAKEDVAAGSNRAALFELIG